MERIKNDPRFAKVLKDPRFRRAPKHERKVKIDDRFKGMFKDERFTLKYTMDKRGRPINHTSNEDLKRFYELSSSEDEVDEEESPKKTKKKSSKLVAKEKDKKKKKLINNDVSDSEVKEVEKSLKFKKNKKCEELNDNSLIKIKSVKDSSVSSEKIEQDDKKKSKGKDKVESKRIESLAKKNKKIEERDDGDLSDDKLSVNESESEEESQDSSEDEDLARGEGNIESSDSDDTSESDSENEKDGEFSHPWGELDTEAPETTEITRRLAVCNMDWDRIKANDILVLLNSFKPADGVISCVKIYPSEYGKERMKEENLLGPRELVEKKLSDDENVEENDEGSKFHMERLRTYQLNRLKYYYAVVECDSANTSNKIYEECNGLEYESSSVRLDLRFIPDSMTFNEEPTSIAEKMPDPLAYNPSIFLTTALQQAKVHLTWDETDPDRIKMTEEAFTKKDLDKNTLKAYIASSDDDYEDEFKEAESDSEKEKSKSSDNITKNEEKSKTSDKIAKYRALLLSIDEVEKKKSEKDVDMEITWTPGLKEATIDAVMKKKSKEQELTPWEEYLKKKKEKRQQKRDMKKKKESDEEYSDDELPDDIDLNEPFFKDAFGPEFKNPSKKSKSTKHNNTKEAVDEENEEKRKAELELLLLGQHDGKFNFNVKNSNEKKSKKKRLNDDVQVDESFKVDVNDNRFSALFTSHLYNVDQSNPLFKKTKGMEAIINEKIKRRTNTDLTESSAYPLKKFKLQELPNRTKDLELSSLVKSVKRKTYELGSDKRWKK